MDISYHVYYQRLITDRCTLADAVQTFVKVLSDTRRTNGETLAFEAESMAPDTGEVDHYYGALAVKQLFESSSPQQIDDYINLAHKEALARRISILIHDDAIDLQLVEQALQEFAELPVGESQVSTNIAIGVRVRLVSVLISDNLFYIGVAKNYITMRDVAALTRRYIGKYGQRSRIGGKSAGMILANRILLPGIGEPTGFEDLVEEVESYYVTARVFNQFIEHNRLEEGHGLKYLDAEERDRFHDDLARRFLRGVFPKDVRVQLQEVLESLGDCPLIVRSSSLLEDNMGFPFYGKYDSVFISNQGSTEERLNELLQAIKQVYVSILASSVIEYRKDKALLDYDDVMCVLIQKVVGQQHGDYFFPEVAGVAFSRNQYRWSPRIRVEDGVARIVYGLGTRAVDRSGDDYPRLVALSHPGLRPEGTQAEKIKYSQRFVDVLNLRTRCVETVHFIDLFSAIRSEAPASQTPYTPDHAVSVVHNDDLSVPGIFPDTLEYGSAAITFDGLLGNARFADLLRKVLARLQEAYGVPVDVEFACRNGKLVILQCRPLAEGAVGGKPVVIPEATSGQRLLFDSRRDIFRSGVVADIRYVVMVDNAHYRALPNPQAKAEVARVVGRINRALKGSRFILIGPGRWGSSNMDLGVKVGYGEINNASVLVEVADASGDYTPEVSYGTHFFQDLVEAEIIPLPLYPDDTKGRTHLEILRECPSAVADILPENELPDSLIAATVRVVDLEKSGLGSLSIHLNADESRGVGLLG